MPMQEKRATAYSDYLIKAWYQGSAWLYCLWPLSLVYRVLISVRRQCYRLGLFKRYKASVPIIVVGNITLGGTGKTPLVIALCQELKQAGFKPGVISRGYGSQASVYPYEVTSKSPVAESGDEPLLIAKATACPVFISSNRQKSIEALLELHQCDVIISDDGLQHYALERDIEIVVIDGQRQFGNKACLPMGPLREPLSRLKNIDLAVINGTNTATLPLEMGANFNMALTPLKFINLHNQKQITVEEWGAQKHVHAVAGIGNPGRFFSTLEALGFSVIPHSFADHYHYSASDLAFSDDKNVIMTEKDAVKVADFSKENHWYLSVEATLEPNFFEHILQLLPMYKQKS